MSSGGLSLLGFNLELLLQGLIVINDQKVINVILMNVVE